MKILVIHTSYRYKGGEDVVFEQEVALLRKNHTVEVLHFKNKKGFLGAYQFLISIWNITANNLVKNKIASFEPDVVHIHNWHFAFGPFVIRGIKKEKIPLVATIHNFRLICPSSTLFFKGKLYTKSLQEDFFWSAIKDKVYRNSYLQTFWLTCILWFHKKIKTFQLIDLFVFPSQFMINFYTNSTLQIDKTKCVVKPNFCKTQTYFTNADVEDYYLYVGRLSEEKGILFLLSFFEKSNRKLKIIGKGPLQNLVKEKSNQYKNIEYLGFLDNEKIEVELQKATALIFPSIWYEPFGLTIIEAFSNKCMVIASNIGAPEELVKDGFNGFHFAYNDVVSLENVLNMCENHSEEKQNEIRNNAYQTHQNKFSTQSQTEQLEKIYKRVVP